MKKQNRDLETVEIGLTGNTINKPKSTSGRKIQETQYKKWCFTFNNYSSRDKVEIEQGFKKNANSYTFEKEIGSAGNLHLQGFVCLKTKRRLTELKKMFSSCIHWEPCNNTIASIEYCQKDADCKTDIFSVGLYTDKMLFFDLMDDAEDRFADFNYYMDASIKNLILEYKCTCESMEDIAALLNVETWELRRKCMFDAIDNLINTSLERNIMDKYYQHLLYKSTLEQRMHRQP